MEGREGEDEWEEQRERVRSGRYHHSQFDALLGVANTDEFSS